MKIKYSALVSATSGKLNGSVAASNRGGAYIRNKGVVSNPQTPSQQANRSLFGSISSQFRDLSAAQVLAWNNAAQNFPIIDRFGDTRFLSGLALFVRLNSNLTAIGAPTLVNPPLPESFPAQIELALTVENTAGNLSELLVQLTTDRPNTLGYTMIVRATPPLSVTQNFFKNKLRRIGTVAGAGSPEIELTDPVAYTSIFGVPPVGSQIYIETVLVNNSTGQMSPVFARNVTVIPG